MSEQALRLAEQGLDVVRQTLQAHAVCRLLAANHAMTTVAADWRCWAWVGGKYERIVDLVPGHMEIIDPKRGTVSLLRTHTIVITEGA